VRACVPSIDLVGPAALTLVHVSACHGLHRGRDVIFLTDSTLWLDYQIDRRHNSPMEAGVRELRDHLSRYLEIVREGQEVTVTDHGNAVARLIPLDQPRAIDRLIRDGVISPAQRSKRLRSAPGIEASGTVSDLTAEQRQ